MFVVCIPINIEKLVGLLVDCVVLLVMFGVCWLGSFLWVRVCGAICWLFDCEC